MCPKKLKFCLKTRQPGSTFYFFRHILDFFVWLSTLTVGIPYTLLEWWTCIEAKGELKCHLMFSRYPMERTRTCSTVIKPFFVRVPRICLFIATFDFNPKRKKEFWPLLFSNCKSLKKLTTKFAFDTWSPTDLMKRADGTKMIVEILSPLMKSFFWLFRIIS